jgi:hypothetical protein
MTKHWLSFYRDLDVMFSYIFCFHDCWSYSECERSVKIVIRIAVDGVWSCNPCLIGYNHSSLGILMLLVTTLLQHFFFIETKREMTKSFLFLVLVLYCWQLFQQVNTFTPMLGMERRVMEEILVLLQMLNSIFCGHLV